MLRFYFEWENVEKHIATLYSQNDIFCKGELTIGIFVIFSGMFLTFTDFQKCTWLRLTFCWNSHKPHNVNYNGNLQLIVTVPKVRKRAMQTFLPSVKIYMYRFQSVRHQSNCKYSLFYLFFIFLLFFFFGHIQFLLLRPPPSGPLAKYVENPLRRVTLNLSLDHLYKS